jgi:hypothetical protein
VRLSGWALAALLLCGFDWNVPKLLEWSEVGDQLQANGMPLKIFVARSAWKPGDLLDHYQARFAKAGFYTPEKPLKLPGLELPRLTALDTESMWSYLVYVWPEPDGSTTLVLGAADLKGKKKDKAASGFSVAAFPGATVTFTSNVEFARTMSFTAKATEAEVIDFYRQTLPAAGWKEREPGSFVRGGRLLRAATKQTKEGLQVVMVDEADLPPLFPPNAPKSR